MKKEHIATIGLITIAIIWGFAFIGVDYALANGWQTFPLLFARGIIGAAVVLPFCIKKRFWRNKQTMRMGMITGVLFFGGYALQTAGQALSSVPNSAFLTALNVIFVPIIMRVFLKQPISKKVYIASVIALIGVANLSLFGMGKLQIHMGDILLILCAIFFALQIIYAKKCGKECDPISITFIQLFTMGLLSLIWMPITGQTILPKAGFSGVLYAAIFSSAIASILQFCSQKYVHPGKASLILCQESLIATLLAVIILKQPFHIYMIIGSICLLFAILLVEIDWGFLVKKKKD